MIIDAFCFFREFDMLKLRCEIMKNPNVLHVLVECTHTFSGIPKKLYFQENQEDFKNYPIAAFVVDNPPNNGNAWDNEKHQRNFIMQAIAKLTSLYYITDNTKVIIADCDEVIDISKIINWEGEFASLMLDKFGLYLNVLEGAQSWNRARIMKWSYLKQHSPEEVRNSGFPETISNAGQHWSYIGGTDEILRKAAAFSHQEPDVQRHFTRDNIEHKLKTVESLWGQDNWTVVPIDTLPKYIQDHQEELSHLIYKP